MARKTLSETRKSKWLNAKDKKQKPPPKPIFPLQEGTLVCSYCKTPNNVEANSQLISGYPYDTFWVVAECRKCNNVLAGYAELGQDSEA